MQRSLKFVAVLQILRFAGGGQNIYYLREKALFIELRCVDILPSISGTNHTAPIGPPCEHQQSPSRATCSEAQGIFFHNQSRTFRFWFNFLSLESQVLSCAASPYCILAAVSCTHAASFSVL